MDVREGKELLPREDSGVSAQLVLPEEGEEAERSHRDGSGVAGCSIVAEGLPHSWAWFLQIKK